MSNLEPLIKLSELLRRELRIDECSSDLQAAIGAGDPSKILRQVETELESKPDDLLLRAMWVKNSLKLDSIPLSVFVGPISSLLSEEKSGTKTVELFVTQSTLEYLERLLSKKQFVLVHDVTEALIERVKRSTVGLDLVLYDELQQLLVSSSKGELPSAAPASVSAAATSTSEEDLDETPIEIPSSGPLAQDIPSTVVDQSTKSKHDFAQTFQRVKTPIVLTLAATIMVVGLRALFDSFNEGTQTQFVVPVTKLASATPMISPEVIGNINLGPDHTKRLDSVNQRVKGLEISTAEAQKQQSGDSTTSTTLPGLNKSEVADLEPIGPPEKAPPAVVKKLPDVSASKPVEVSNLDVPDRTPRIKDLQVGRDGRLYGPSVDKDPYKAASAGEGLKTLDGKPVQSFEVRNFPAPRRYKTIVTTKVLTAPSMLSTEVARLQPDAKIVVISSMGPWLELRSKNGTRGYIYSQDAVPVEEE
jgi:hypothetical protein